jgi:hypothetical protein
MAANAWTAGNFLATSATTNFFATTGTIYFTGVIILPGSEAPSAARSPFIMRSFDQELVLCKRYWERSMMYFAGYSPAGAGLAAMGVPFSVEKRASPTVTQISASFNNCSLSTYGADATRGCNCVVNVAATGTFVINTNVASDARL